MNRSQLLRNSWRGWMSQSYATAGPAWWQWVWTLLFSALVALGFSILALATSGGTAAGSSPAEWATFYFGYLVVSMAIGVSIHALFDLLRWRLGRERIRNLSAGQRRLLFSGVPLVGLAAGWLLGMALLGIDVRRAAPGEANGWVGGVALSLLVWFMFQLYFSSRHRQLAAERRATEAQLKLLQGQIEPHFLFNTLANVLGLMDADPPRARLMLESFVEYLRGSLGSLRLEQQTLGHEVDLVSAYLRIVTIRMEGRLRYAVDVPEALRGLPLPALMLQPLVENAVRHGLEPKVAGGCVTLTARLGVDTLTLSVSDDGLGLAAAQHGAAHGPSPLAGSGTALANIRERLQQRFGDSASLRIEPALPHGVSATLTLPTTS